MIYDACLVEVELQEIDERVQTEHDVWLELQKENKVTVGYHYTTTGNFKHTGTATESLPFRLKDWPEEYSDYSLLEEGCSDHERSGSILLTASREHALVEHQWQVDFRKKQTEIYLKRKANAEALAEYEKKLKIKVTVGVAVNRVFSESFYPGKEFVFPFTVSGAKDALEMYKKLVQYHQQPLEKIHLEGGLDVGKDSRRKERREIFQVRGPVISVD